MLPQVDIMVNMVREKLGNDLTLVTTGMDSYNGEPPMGIGLPGLENIMLNLASATIETRNNLKTKTFGGTSGVLNHFHIPHYQVHGVILVHKLLAAKLDLRECVLYATVL